MYIIATLTGILLYVVIMIIYSIYVRLVNKYKEGRVWTAHAPFNIDTKLWLENYYSFVFSIHQWYCSRLQLYVSFYLSRTSQNTHAMCFWNYSFHQQDYCKDMWRIVWILTIWIPQEGFDCFATIFRQIKSNKVKYLIKYHFICNTILYAWMPIA